MARDMWVRARVCRTLLCSSRRASWPTTQTAQERVPAGVGPTELLTSSVCGLSACHAFKLAADPEVGCSAVTARTPAAFVWVVRQRPSPTKASVVATGTGSGRPTTSDDSMKYIVCGSCNASNLSVVSVSFLLQAWFMHKFVLQTLSATADIPRKGTHLPRGCGNPEHSDPHVAQT